MARPATGKEVLAHAKAALAKARTVEQMREAQAVILPLEHGLSMDQVATILGISRGWACSSGVASSAPQASRQSRNQHEAVAEGKT